MNNSGSPDSLGVWSFVRPSFPYTPGHEPTSVEYQVQRENGDLETLITEIDEAIPCNPSEVKRYRFHRGARPGAWSVMGVTWPEPRN
jgi:hypothetical protein